MCVACIEPSKAIRFSYFSQANIPTYKCQSKIVPTQRYVCILQYPNGICIIPRALRHTQTHMNVLWSAKKQLFPTTTTTANGSQAIIIWHITHNTYSIFMNAYVDIYMIIRYFQEILWDRLLASSDAYRKSGKQAKMCCIWIRVILSHIRCVPSQIPYHHHHHL